MRHQLICPPSGPNVKIDEITVMIGARSLEPSQHVDVGSTLWKQSKAFENETKSDVGFSTLQNVDTLKQRRNNVAQC